MRPRIGVNFSHFEPEWPDFPSNFDQYFPYVRRSYELELADQPEVLFYSCFGEGGNFWRAPDGRSVRLMPTIPSGTALRVFITGENVEPVMEACDYAISFSALTDHTNHLRLPLWVYEDRTAGFTPEMLIKPADTDWEKIAAAKTRFCNFNYSNRVLYRNNVFRMLNQHKRVDAAGPCMNNMTDGNARGSQKERIEFRRPYKFTLAVENFIWPGYVTEKLVRPMFVNSIPIYIGDPLARQTFDTSSYIDINCFSSLKEMLEFVQQVDNDRKLYLDMLAAPFYRGNRLPDCARDETARAFFDRIFAHALMRRG
jgi:hypothetical protein